MSFAWFSGEVELLDRHDDELQSKTQNGPGLELEFHSQEEFNHETSQLRSKLELT
jgi:hypothetical protein